MIRFFSGYLSNLRWITRKLFRRFDLLDYECTSQFAREWLKQLISSIDAAQAAKNFWTADDPVLNSHLPI